MSGSRYRHDVVSATVCRAPVGFTEGEEARFEAPSDRTSLAVMSFGITLVFMGLGAVVACLGMNGEWWRSPEESGL